MKQQKQQQQQQPVFAGAHETIASLLPILDAFAHRHRNQHSASHWWATFSIFRRAARRLDVTLISASASTSTTLGRSINASRSRGSESDNNDVQHRASWMARHVLPRSYIAFSQLAADNQHAPLGLMLLAVVARINSVISDLLPSDAPLVSVKPVTASPSPASGPDMGVAISRNDIVPTITTPASIQSEPPSSSRPNRVIDEAAVNMKKSKKQQPEMDSVKDQNKKKKKKRKGGDELSSLFSSLS